MRNPIFQVLFLPMGKLGAGRHSQWQVEAAMSDVGLLTVLPLARMPYDKGSMYICLNKLFVRAGGH